jgi:predicted transcriptional regulator
MKRRRNSVAVVVRVSPEVAKKLDKLTEQRNRSEGLDLSRAQVVLGFIHEGLKRRKML